MIKPWIATAAALILLATALVDTSSAQPVLSRQQILEETRAIWDNLSHFEVTFHENHPDQGTAGIDYKYELDFTKDGRYRIETHRKLAGEIEKPASSYLGNAKEEINLIYFDKPPFALRQVGIDPRQGEAGHYIGPKNHFLWAFMPCGKPIYAHLSDEEVEIRPAGRDGLYELRTRHNTHPIAMLLDPAHDWLPRSVEFVGGPSSYKILEFRQAEGRWFPSRVGVEKTVKNPDGTSRRQNSEMVLDRVVVNGPIDPTHYQLPELPKGIVIDDRIRGERKAVGTWEDAMKRFEENSGPIEP